MAHLLAVELQRGAAINLTDLAAEWQAHGADELIVSWVRPDDLPALLQAANEAALGR